jgi:[ribosomal protein S5]-alanine N-acetyltransferase
MAELRTNRLLLRPWAPVDEAALVRYANNWNVARYLRDAFPHPYTLADAQQWIARNTSVVSPTLDFAIILDTEAIGSVGLLPKTDIWRCGMELGYWVAEPFWGQGIASEAVAAAVGYAFNTFPDITVVHARHVVSNIASGRVLTKCGFALDGRLRQAAIKNGVVSDVLVYSRTRVDTAYQRQ